MSALLDPLGLHRSHPRRLRGRRAGISKSDTDSGKNTAAADRHFLAGFPGFGAKILVLHMQTELPESEFHARQSLIAEACRIPFQATAIDGIGESHAGARERIEPVRRAEVILPVRHDCEHLLLAVRAR